MKNIIRIFLADYKRISRNVIAIVVILGLTIIPCLYAWFNILSNWDPYGPSSTGNIKIAVASDDDGYSIGSFKINIGDKVKDGLKGNKTLGWVFVKNSEDAIEGVKSGDYYAALVMPKDFSKTMFEIMYGNLEHPKIIYYSNEKKNAIAPKITGKAPTAVKEQVNSTFVSTITEVMTQIFGTVSDVNSHKNISNTLDKNVSDLKNDLQIYVNVLNSFSALSDSAENMLTATQSVIPGFEASMKSSVSAINALQGSTIELSGQSQNISGLISQGLDTVDSSIDSTINMLNTATSAGSQASTSINDKIIASKAVIPYIKQMYQNSISAMEGKLTPDQQKQADKITADLETIEKDLEDLSTTSKDTQAKLEKIQNTTINELNTCKKELSQLKTTFNTSVKPSLDQTMNSMMNSLLSVETMLCGINSDFTQVSNTISSYKSTLAQSSKTVKESAKTAQNLLNVVNDVDAKITKLKNDEQYKKIASMLNNDPQALANFIASPVNIETVKKYPIDNYGSAMAPFYSVLALWVGALILVAIVHAKFEPDDDFKNVKNYQTYFGRYITFFLVGQAQALLLTLGNFFFVEIQCRYPFLFWFAASVTSFVFTLFIYSLTYAFGNVGEAIAVIVLVIQVAGAGCTFPIDVLSDVFKRIYNLLPFQFGMNALKETIGGLYGNDYWINILKYTYVVVLSLLTGLLLEKPCRKLNSLIEKSKKDADLFL